MTLPDHQPQCCLLHRDLHPMGRECLEAIGAFFIAHEHIKPEHARDAYQEEWERCLLDDLFRRHSPGRPPTPGRA